MWLVSCHPPCLNLDSIVYYQCSVKRKEINKKKWILLTFFLILWRIQIAPVGKYIETFIIVTNFIINDFGSIYSFKSLHWILDSEISPSPSLTTYIFGDY